MKKLLLMAAATFVSAGSVFADAPEALKLPATPLVLQEAQNPVKENVLPPTSEPLVGVVGVTGDINMINFGTEFENYIGENFLGATSMLSYDPVSGIAAFPVIGRTVSESGQYVGTDMDIRAMNLRGLKQDEPTTSEELQNYVWIDSTYREIGPDVGESGFIHYYPSISLLNPTGTGQTFSDLTYMVMTNAVTFTRGVGDPQFNRKGGVINIIDPIIGLDLGSSGRNQVQGGPLNNNPDGRFFNQMNASPYQGDYGDGYSYGTFYTGLLSEPNTNDVASTYGFLNLDLTVGTPESYVPQGWTQDNFRSDAQYSTSHVQSDVTFPSQGERVYWAGLNGFFSDDFDNRKLAVSWSTDGVNFSNWSKMSQSLVNNYVNTRPEFENLVGYEVTIGFGQNPYTPYGFIALDGDRASIFTTALIFRPNDNEAEAFYHIVQATYTRSTNEWKMEKVADASTSNRLWVSHVTNFRSSVRANFPPNVPAFYLDDGAQMGSSIQASKNPNGDIIVKYTKYTDLVELETPLTYFTRNADGDYVIPEENTIDSIQIDEIFISEKKAGSDNWEEFQITNADNRVHPYNFISNRYDDRTMIPLLNYTAQDRSNYNQSTSAYGVRVRDSLTNETYSMYRFALWRNQIGYADLEAAFPADTTSVTEENFDNGLDLQILEISPNPVVDNVSLAWSSENTVDSKVYISNVTGQKVMTVFEGKTYGLVMKEGIDLSRLPNGTYYLTLEAEGQNVTKLLNIAR